MAHVGGVRPRIERWLDTHLSVTSDALCVRCGTWILVGRLLTNTGDARDDRSAAKAQDEYSASHSQDQ